MISNKLDALREIRAEITRINKAAGYTVFNPTATSLLDELIEEEFLEEACDVVDAINAGEY